MARLSRLGSSCRLGDAGSRAGAWHTANPADTLALADALTISWVQDRTGDTVTLSGLALRVVTSARTVTDGVILTDQTVDAQGIRSANRFAHGLGDDDKDQGRLD